jgi:hypothetical protein
LRIETLDSTPPPKLAAALEEFESQFRYPLGSDAWFRISHGADYTRFFRAMGDARCFVALRDDKVVGIITSAICRLRQPDGHFGEAGYVSDLKVADSVAGPTLLRLLGAVTDWISTVPKPAFCVVMHGTSRNPTQYTGRLGIPAFHELSRLMILRIPCAEFAGNSTANIEHRNMDVVKSQYQQLTTNHFATDGGDASVRSQMTPVGLVHVSGNACGILEDTRRGKMLFSNDGAEMISAHLSCFGYRTTAAAIDLIAAAAQQALQRQMPALFLSIADTDAAALLEQLPQQGIVKATATVFGYAFTRQEKWSINTAEI